MKSLTPLLLAISLNTIAAESKQVLVQGNCHLKVAPDKGTITFTAENTSKNQKEAVNKTNQQINELKEKIIDLKLKNLDFKNTQYSVYPVREYEKDHYVEKGTRASLSLEVTTSEITKLGQTLALASELNIKNVGSLMTFLSEEKREENYLRCLDIAALDAKNKATQLAKKLNFKLGPVISVNEAPVSVNPPPYPVRTMMKASMMASADMVETNIEAGEQNFSTSLQISFAIQ
jgi:uncharacterized protein YggE